MAALERRRRRIVRSGVAHGDRADRRQLGWDAERFAQRGDLLGRDAEEQRPQARVDGGQQDQHRGHARVDVPVRRRPVRFGPVRPAFIRFGVALQVGGLVRQAHDQQRRLEQVLPAECIGVGRADRVPVRLRLLGAFEHQKRPALAEARGRRALRVAQDALDDVGRQWPRLEAAHHAPLAHDVLKLHPGGQLALEQAHVTLGSARRAYTPC